VTGVVWTVHALGEWLFYLGALFTGGCVGFAAGHRRGKRFVVRELREYVRIADRPGDDVPDDVRDRFIGGLTRCWLDVVDPLPATVPTPMSWKDRL
jgi:hypothetical protein